VSTHAFPVPRAGRLRVAAARIAASPDLVALAGLAALLVVLAASSWNRWGNVDNDTGYDSLAGLRLAHGELPYVDYVYWYGPLAPFALGFASLLGGDGMTPGIGFGLVIAAALVLCTYALARALTGVLGGALAAALVAPLAFSSNQFSYVDPHTHSATLGALTTMAVLLALMRYGRSSRRAWLVAAGVFAGLTALTRPEFELAVVLGCAGWLVTRSRSGIVVRRELTSLALGAVAIPVAVYGAFAGVVGPRRLITEDLYPTAFLHAAGSHMLHARTPFTLSSFATVGGKLALYAAGAAALVGLARIVDRGGAARMIVIAGAGLAVVVTGFVLIADPEALRHALQFPYAWIPAGAAIVAALLVGRGRAGSELEVGATIAVAVVALATYASFYAYSFSPQMAIYALPLAAPFLVRLHLGHLARGRTGVACGAVWLAFLAAVGIGLTLHDDARESATIRGPGGAIAATPMDAPAYQQAVNWIEAHTRRGEPILLAPQLTWLYLVTERANPLPQLSLLPGALDGAAGQRKAIARLDAARVDVVVIEERKLTGYGHTQFGGSFDRVLAAWIHRTFDRAAVVRGQPGGPQLEIWSRRIR
jgi:hypothetical protein